MVDDNKGFYFTFVPGTITIHEGNQNTAQVTYNKDSKDITVEDPASDSSADPVCGEYECSQYVDNGNANDWHYVTVTQEEKGYKWSNRAGRSWMLDAETLDIGDWAVGFKFQDGSRFWFHVSKTIWLHFCFPVSFDMGCFFQCLSFSLGWTADWDPNFSFTFPFYV